MDDGRRTESISWDLDQRTFRLALFVLVAVLTYVHWDWLVAGRPIYGNDSSLFYPMGRDLARWLAEGQFPQWSDRYLCGQPAAAEANFFLYHPLRLILLRWAGSQADGIWIWLHSLLAAGGMVAYGRSVGFSRAATLLAAYSYPLSGFFVGHIIHPNTFAVAAWVPLQLALVEGVRLRVGALPPALLAIACGLQWLSGQPQVAMLTNYYLASYCVLRSLVFPPPGWSRAWRPSLVTAYALLLGVVLAAVQLLPLRDVLEQTGRLGNMPYEFAASTPLPPWGFLLPLFPALYGTEGPSDEAVFWLSKTSTWAFRTFGSWEFHFYPGAVVTLLAIYAVVRMRANPLCRTHLVIAILALLFALGDWTPIHWILWHLPGIDAGRVPSRSLLFATVSLVVLAALAFDQVAANRGQALKTWMRVSLVSVLCLVAGWTIGGAIFHFAGSLLVKLTQTRLLEAVGADWIAAAGDDELRRGRAFQIEKSAWELLQQQRHATAPWSVPTAINFAIVVASALVVVGWMRRREGTSRGWMLAIVAVLCLDLLWFGQTFGARAADDPHPHAPPPYVPFLNPSQRVLSLVDPDEARVGSWNQYRTALPTQLTAAWQLDTPDGNTGLAPNVFMRDVMLPLTNPRIPGKERLLQAVRSEDLLRLLGVGALVTGTDWGTAPWQRLYEGEGARVWRIPDPLPRAFTSTRLELADIRSRGPGDDPQDLQAVLRSAEPLMPAAAPSSPDEVEYEVGSAEPTTLVRTVRMFPGWRAYIDGEPARIQEAFGFFQGVLVPPGTHRVRFEFRHDALRHGLMLSGVGCLFLLSLAVASIRGRNSRTSAPNAP